MGGQCFPAQSASGATTLAAAPAVSGSDRSQQLDRQLDRGIEKASLRAMYLTGILTPHRHATRVHIAPTLRQRRTRDRRAVVRPPPKAAIRAPLATSNDLHYRALPCRRRARAAGLPAVRFVAAKTSYRVLRDGIVTCENFNPAILV
jgi:hypothetical protein